MMNPYELDLMKQHQREVRLFVTNERNLRMGKQVPSHTRPEHNLRSLLESAANAALSTLL